MASAWTTPCWKSSPTRTPTSSRPTTSCSARTRPPAGWPRPRSRPSRTRLSFKCDGCLYNEFCMKWSAEQEDLSLLPVHDRAPRRRPCGGRASRPSRRSPRSRTSPPATPASQRDLVPAPGREAQVKQLAATWPVGPRLDELIHRARSFRRSVRKDGTQALGYIPGKGNSSLPVSTPDLNPNLVRIYLDAQHDYLERPHLPARGAGRRLQGRRRRSAGGPSST